MTKGTAKRPRQHPIHHKNVLISNRAPPQRKQGGGGGHASEREERPNDLKEPENRSASIPFMSKGVLMQYKNVLPINESKKKPLQAATIITPKTLMTTHRSQPQNGEPDARARKRGVSFTLQCRTDDDNIEAETQSTSRRRHTQRQSYLPDLP
jgi:hypothetical protein